MWLYLKVRSIYLDILILISKTENISFMTKNQPVGALQRNIHSTVLTTENNLIDCGQTALFLTL
jgi:hypothetical protein